jgi:hypothetical protein
VGESVGGVGVLVGENVGESEGAVVGDSVGGVGAIEGEKVGISEGADVGESVGGVGMFEGAKVGESVGGVGTGTGAFVIVGAAAAMQPLMSKDMIPKLGELVKPQAAPLPATERAAKAQKHHFKKF